ncbi:MAG: Asp-tRNA(Asn)/Glu-tRNA(Gln) amidotransferase subunit GatC [Alphaproteobacteria bacterium]|nr:Asp-tRNA(Asn)/Glu-tRNA(Gln) amidotransferase subunit GatC [Alphaproteobacteria bacterium]
MPANKPSEIDTATVRRIARLARIAVKDAELPALAKELGGILAWVAVLDEVDTAAVAPMASVHDEVLRWREDRVTDGGYSADIVANAPAQEAGFFAVPKVVE